MLSKVKVRFTRNLLVYLVLSMLVSSNAFLINKYYGFYDLPEPEKISYENDFWDLKKMMSCPKHKITFLEAKEGVEVYDVYYLSEIYGKTEITIHSLLIKPKGKGPFPALVLIHGTNGTCYTMFKYALMLAQEGFVVLAPTMPGREKSSKFPPCTRNSIVNSTKGPTGAYYYHCVVAVIKAISLLQALDFVISDEIGVSGASMGGIITFIVSAIDPRVKVAIPIVACGEYDVHIKAGTLANLMVPEQTSVNSLEAITTLKYFDVIAYATRLSKPTLMLVSTNDEFFALNAINDTFNVLQCKKAINLAPNHGHFKEFPGWGNSALLWLKSNILKKGKFPKIQLDFKVDGLYPKEVYINAIVKDVESLEGDIRVRVFYHTNLHLSSWHKIDLKLNESGKITIIEPTNRVLIFAALYTNDKQIVSTPVYEVRVNLSLPMSIIMFLVLLCSLIVFKERISTKILLNLSLWTLIHFLFLSPSIELIGRSRLTFLSLIDRYVTVPVVVGLGIISIILLLIPLILALRGLTISFLIVSTLLSVPIFLAIFFLNKLRFPATPSFELLTMTGLSIVFLTLVILKRKKINI